MNPFWVIRILSISAGIAGLSMVAIFAWQAAADVDTSPPARTQQVQEVDDPEVQDPEVQEPEVQDPETQDPEVQDPDAGSPEVQDPDADDPEAQDPDADDPEAQDPEVQDPEIQGPEIQDPEIQDPEVDDPDPGGLSCPAGFTAEKLVLNAPGGQVTLFVCIMQ